MLERVVCKNGVVVYRSPVLAQTGVRHGFSTRCGGVSPGPFDSLNLGNPKDCQIQDDPDHISENYRRLLEAIGCPDGQLCRVHQVHGRRAVRFSSGRMNDNERADAIVSDDPGCVASVRTADCVPILLASEDGKTVAAVHAGWRGVVCGMVPAAVEEIGNGRRLVAAVGPCIGVESFEVGGEVLEEFGRAFGDRAPIRRESNGKGRVNLREAVRIQLLDAGVPADCIDMTDRCTYRDRNEFYSHRRERGVTGRMAAVISPRK